MGVSRGQVCSVECFAGWAVLANEGSAGWSYVTLAGTRRDSLARPPARQISREQLGRSWILSTQRVARAGDGILSTQRNYVLKIFRAARAHLFRIS